MGAPIVMLYTFDHVSYFTTVEEAQRFHDETGKVGPMSEHPAMVYQGSHYLLKQVPPVSVDARAIEDYYDALREHTLNKLSDAELRSLGLKLDSEGCLVRI